VIVPAYNGAKRIERTISSIVEQDCDDIEIIVVDDASSDGTGEVAGDALARSGRDFRIITREANGGCAASRNSGLREASGDYVIFFDADDIADPDFVSTLLGAITKNDSEVAFCGYRKLFEETGEEREVPLGLHHARHYSAEELTVMYIFSRIKPAIWTTIFKKSFLTSVGLEFTEVCRFAEDVEFLTKAFSRSRSIFFSTGCHYTYLQHVDMMSKTTRQTRDKFIRRYADNAAVVCRTARYLAEHAESPKVRDVAVNFMMAEGLIKTLNVAAMRNDEAEYYRMLSEPETRWTLAASRRYFFQKPEVFVKAARLLFAPRAYFRKRLKSCG